jgi:hypothetical protein
VSAGSSGLVYNTPEILKIAATYYKNMFRWEDRCAVSLDDNFWTLDEMVSPGLLS